MLRSLRRASYRGKGASSCKEQSGERILECIQKKSQILESPLQNQHHSSLGRNGGNSPSRQLLMAGASSREVSSTTLLEELALPKA
ncbi:unnamed protein product [Victoria cruziana]